VYNKDQMIVCKIDDFDEEGEIKIIELVSNN
jgi:hypothetical protein